MSDLRRLLMEGQEDLGRVGAVTAGKGKLPPFVVVDSAGVEVEPVTRYLRDLALSDMSPLTSRSYGYDLLRWFRVLWALEVDWERATGADVDVLVGWMRTARNPQRRRTRAGGATPGTVNIRTGKPALAEGYAPRTINHCLTAVYGFYAYHQHFGRGPVANPVPSSRARRMALAHRSPIDAKQRFKRARLRQRVADTTPRAIPDAMWDELFAAMTCDRDRSLLLCYVSSGARASELLGVALGDVDWAGSRMYVISKGTRLRQAVPISPEAIRYLTRYLDAVGLPGPDEPLWRTRRGASRAVSYWAMRRVLQRANEKLGTNWSLHDLRHTASTRMANDSEMTLRDVQAVLRHANIETTGRYMTVRVEDMFDKLQEHYNRPRPQRTFAAGYDEADVKAVFGG
ncbi:tyrosine-type recombinase/integrase [Nocardia sp. NRRL S-836]|uniref:tyrosine-type recombinase/integrase n=1 Tax=Nocardia sp. NRRL S-836 TaxID=1519492 RepID=UPI000AE513E1|nr:tyrosine-type recombinase/integrase [Nocardia sp. NRRL S-836]